jgi:hypothetical protein
MSFRWPPCSSELYVLGDLKIEGDVHAPTEVRNSILAAWKDREYDSSQALVDSVMKDGIRGDFQDRGYFKVVVQDPLGSRSALLAESSRFLSSPRLSRVLSFDLGL